MIPCPAQYLLRFDDLCPTQPRRAWERFPPLLAEYGIRPILGIIPDNRDPDLQCGEPDPGFWAEMRALQANGAAIGLHGYRHLCGSSGRSLVPLNHESEFAGVADAMQRNWIREGLRILRSQGLAPTIWVAPRHGFDRATLRVLREGGIGVVSDGFARRSYLHEGVTWIPQQLWAPVEKKNGLWTICLHPATMIDAEFEKLHQFLRAHGGQFTWVEKVIAEIPPTPLSWFEHMRAQNEILRYRVRKTLKRFLRVS